MTLWLVDFDFQYIYRTLIISLFLILLTIIIFRFTWLKSPNFKMITSEKKIHQKTITGFLHTMKFLLYDILNYNFYIEHIGFDGYTYILFLRKVILTLIFYLISFFYISLLYYFVDVIVSLKNTDETYFNQIASSVYLTIMLFILSVIVIISARDFRREIQKLYGFYILKAEKEEIGGFYKHRTILIKGIKGSGVMESDLVDGINKFFKENNIEGRIIGCRFLPDYSKIFEIEKKKIWYELLRELYKKKIMNKFSFFFVSKKVKKQESFEKTILSLEKKIRENFGYQKNSGYAIAYFTTFTAIEKLEEFSKK